MIIYNKKPRLISIKAIIIAIIVAVILYFLPVLTPIVIFALILRINREENARVQTTELHGKYLDEIKRFINFVHSDKDKPINPIGTMIDNELYAEYEDKHARNELQLNKIPDGKRLKEIDTKFDLWKAKECFEEIKENISEIVKPRSSNSMINEKEWVEIFNKKTDEMLERISLLQKKKTFNLQDLLNIKDTYDNLLYFWNYISTVGLEGETQLALTGEKIPLPVYAYIYSRNQSNLVLAKIQKLAKQEWIKLDNCSIYHDFWVR